MQNDSSSAKLLSLNGYELSVQFYFYSSSCIRKDAKINEQGQNNVTFKYNQF